MKSLKLVHLIKLNSINMEGKNCFFKSKWHTIKWQQVREKYRQKYDVDLDHSAVILTLNDKVIKREAKPTLPNRKTN